MISADASGPLLEHGEQSGNRVPSFSPAAGADVTFLALLESEVDMAFERG